jgi:hypothetical protein
MLRAALLCLCVSQPGLSQQSGCDYHPHQNWFFVNPNLRKAFVTGTLLQKTRRSTSDADWNFFLQPDDGSFLKNSSNHANDNGIVELEIDSRGNPANLNDLFPNGARVEVYGEWVEDSGHDDKSEIHPIYWIRTLNRNPASIFVGQDDSGRFVDATGVRYETIDFAIPVEFPLVTPTIHPPSRTQLFHEVGKLARGTAGAYAWPGTFSISADLQSWWFNNCEWTGVARAGWSPVYWSTVESSTAPLLTESVTYWVSIENHPDGTAQKIAGVDVDVQLASPAGVPFTHSEWDYESSSGITGMIHVVVPQAPHKIHFSMPYAPADDFNQHTWRVNVFATTMSGNISHTGSIQDAVSVDRTVAIESRVYGIIPSSISFSRTDKSGKPGVCADNVHLTVNRTGLLPQIGLRNGSLGWSVAVLRNADGSNNSNPAVVPVTVSAPLSNAGFTAVTFSPPSEEELALQWQHLTAGETNLSRVKVTASAVTELGENVSATEVLSAQCGIGSMPLKMFLDYSYRYLGSLHLAGELEEAMKKAKPEDRRWLAALHRFEQGEKITPAESELLLNRAMMGSKLPALRARPTLKRNLQDSSGRLGSGHATIPTNRR